MLKKFLERQKEEIGIKGFKYIFVKINRRIKNIIYSFVLIVYLPVLMIALIIRIIYKFRIGLVNSKRIGHLAINTTLYCLIKNFFKERKLFKKNNDILIYNVPISNKYLFSKFDEILNFFNPFLLRPLYDLICIFAKKINFFKKLLVPRFAPNIFKKSGAEDRHDLIMRSQAILQFNQKDKNNGKMLLEKMGIKNNKYICLFVRDDNYLKKKFPDEMWNYHEHRNFDIDDFNSMINLIIERGYYVVRMGRDVKKRVSIINPKIIDYPFSSYVSDFADIYLMANCELCISTSTGPECVPRIFKKTLAQISPTIGSMYTNKNVINCMLNIYCKKTNDYLNLEDLAEKKLFYANSIEEYKSKNVEIIKNDSEYYKNYMNFCINIIEGKINTQEIYNEQKIFRDRFQKFRKKGYKFNSIMYLDGNNNFS